MHEYPNLLIGIGASAGGFEPLLDILSSLPADLQAVIVVIKHRDGARHSQLAAIVAHHSELAVREPVDGESLSCMCVYVGQPNEIIEIEGRRFGIHLDGTMQRKLRSDRRPVLLDRPGGWCQLGWNHTFWPPGRWHSGYG